MGREKAINPLVSQRVDLVGEMQMQADRWSEQAVHHRQAHVRLVEGVEVDAGGAAVKQSPDLLPGMGHADLLDRGRPALLMGLHQGVDQPAGFPVSRKSWLVENRPCSFFKTS